MAIATLHEQRVTDQDMNNALRGAFLEGFKEGVSVSQRSLFANTFLDALLDKNQNPSTVQFDACWANADAMLARGRPKKETHEQVQSSQ